MSKYITEQTKNYNCSPTSLFNLGVWLGEEYKLKELEKKCKTNRKGTKDPVFEKALRSLWKGKITVIHLKRCPYDILLQELSNPNCAVIVSHMTNDREWHHSFWTGTRKGYNHFLPKMSIKCAIETTSLQGDLPEFYLIYERPN